MSSAHNAHPESGLWSNLHRKDGRVVAFIVCGSIAGASGLVLQMAGHDATIDGRSIIAAVPLNPGTLLSTIVSPASPAASAVRGPISATTVQSVGIALAVAMTRGRMSKPISLSDS